MRLESRLSAWKARIKAKTSLESRILCSPPDSVLYPNNLPVLVKCCSIISQRGGNWGTETHVEIQVKEKKCTWKKVEQVPWREGKGAWWWLPRTTLNCGMLLIDAISASSFLSISLNHGYCTMALLTCGTSQAFGKGWILWIVQSLAITPAICSKNHWPKCTTPKCLQAMSLGKPKYCFKPSPFRFFGIDRPYNSEVGWPQRWDSYAKGWEAMKSLQNNSRSK